MNQKPTETLHFAEYVSPGHPDRLADAIAERIVRLGTKNGFQSTLVGVEVAIHDDQVFIDGALMFDRDHPETNPVMDFELGQPGEGDRK